MNPPNLGRIVESSAGAGNGVLIRLDLANCRRVNLGQMPRLVGMATVILVRHGRTTANATGVLAGRAVGVKLDKIGRDQAARTGERLAVVPLVGVVSSPLERCRQTSRIILDLQTGSPVTPIEKDITECDYGQWQGRALGERVVGARY